MTSLLRSSRPKVHICSKLLVFTNCHIVSRICFLQFLVVWVWTLASLRIFVRTWRYAVNNESSFLSSINLRVSYIKHWSPFVKWCITFWVRWFECLLVRSLRSWLAKNAPIPSGSYCISVLHLVSTAKVRLLIDDIWYILDALFEFMSCSFFSSIEFKILQRDYLPAFCNSVLKTLKKSF